MFILELAILVVTFLAGAYSMRRWWMASDKPPERAADGSILLRYSRNTLWLGLLSIACGGFFLLAGYLLGETPETGISLILIGVALIIVGVWLMSEYFNSRVIVNHRYVRKRRWLGDDTIIDWPRVEKVSFSPRSGVFVLHGMKSERIKVSRLMRGFSAFKEIMDKQVPQRRVDPDSMKDYEKLERVEQDLLKELGLELPDEKEEDGNETYRVQV